MVGRTRRGAGWIVLAWLAGAGPALADAGDCFGYGDLGTGPGPALGTIGTGAARVPFVRGASAREGCPGPDPACREKAFLVPGDAVILGGTRPGFVCATYVGQAGAVRSGWLPAGAVDRTPGPPAPGPGDWTGTWTAPEATLVVRPAEGVSPLLVKSVSPLSAKGGGPLSVKGEATYGALDPDRVRRGAVNMGSVAGTIAPSGPTLAFTMGDKGTLPYAGGEAADCRLRLRLLPPFLLAEDNSACGGMNVSFTNVYRRTKP